MVANAEPVLVYFTHLRSVCRYKRNGQNGSGIHCIYDEKGGPCKKHDCPIVLGNRR